MSERSFWIRIRRLLQPYGMLVRVENASAAGTPDLCYCLLGKTGWAEFKYLPKYRGEYVVIPSLTQDQVDWLLNWEKSGGTGWLVLGVAADVYAVPPQMVERIYAREETWSDLKHKKIPAPVGPELVSVLSERRP